jgi:hypothetical protein
VYVQLKSQHELNSGSDQHTEVATPSQREMFSSHHNQLWHIIKALNKLSTKRCDREIIFRGEYQMLLGLPSWLVEPDGLDIQEFGAPDSRLRGH